MIVKKEKYNGNSTEGDSSRDSFREEHNVNTKSESKKELKASNELFAVVAVLVIIAGVQVFQTQKLLAAVSGGVVKASVPQTQADSIGLPSQVGGC